MASAETQRALYKVKIQRIHTLPTFLRTEVFIVKGEQLNPLSFTVSRNQKNVVLKPFSFVKPFKNE